MMSDVSKLHDDSCFISKIAVVSSCHLYWTLFIIQITGFSLEFVKEVDFIVFR